MPQSVKAKAPTELSSGVPFVSDKDLRTALDQANVPQAEANAVVEANTDARIDGLRATIAVLAVLALVALMLCRGLPRRQAADTPAEVAEA